MAATMMTQQRFQSHHSEVMELKSPEGDLGDVEADFQSLVNEMVEDGSKRIHKSGSSSRSSSTMAYSTKMTKTTSSSSTSSSSGRSSSKKLTRLQQRAPAKITFPSAPPDPSLVTALPAKVIPEPPRSDVDLATEQQMKVRDRIKRLEKQLSQEGNESPQPPEVIMPRGERSGSGSIRNIADQFENVGEQAPTQDQNNRMTTPTLRIEEFADASSVREIANKFTGQSEEISQSSRMIEGEFKNVKETASMFQEPFSPITIKPPAPFSDPDAPDPVLPVPVLPPAMKKPVPIPVEVPPPPRPAESIAARTPEDHPPLPWKRENSDLYAESSKLSRSESSSSTHQNASNPTHYNAQVRCEVRSRVSPIESIERRTRSETRTSLSTKSSSSFMTSQGSSSKSNFVPSAPTPLARVAAKPPRAESADSAMPKFSLLRSASTGSVDQQVVQGMNRAKSDRDLPKFNVKKLRSSSSFGTKVWSPGSGCHTDHRDGPSRIETSELPSFKDVPPVWTAGRAESPNLGKQYKKIGYNEGSSIHMRSSQENIRAPNLEDSFAWKNADVHTTLPRVQSPTVTLLQKKREGQIPRQTPEYGKDVEGFCKPGEKLYTIKREYESEDEDQGRRKFAVLGPRKFQGVGPTTREGVPTTLKSGVNSEHQGEWYRRMFDSLHKVKDDDYIVIKYKSSKARHGGYMSEPEGYDTDYESGSRYATLNRKKNTFEYDVMDDHPKVRYIYQDYNGFFDRNTKRYVHQPGRIENYVPGFSSLSQKELKNNPEADVKLELHPKGFSSSATPSVERFNSGRMQMSHALRESGYESDSTLVYKKREDQRRQQLDPRLSSQVYKQVQQGGEIPLSGLQKPAPPRPKEPVIGSLPYSSYPSYYDEPLLHPDNTYKYKNSEVNIHYKTPIRAEQKETLSDEEFARRQEEHMQKVYEQERRKKYLSELEDIERRRHTDYFTPLQKPTIPLNRYDDESHGGRRGVKISEPKQVARALFNFNAQNKRELSFNKGDLIIIRRMIDRNWYEGEMRGVVGIFPCNYVEKIPMENLKTSSRKPTEGQARARFNFQAQSSMEMSLSKGEMLVLTRRVDENWYEGRIGNRKGIFPVTYVDALIEPGGDRPTTPGMDPIPRPALPASHLLYNGTSGVSSPQSTMDRSSSQNEKTTFTQLTVNTQHDAAPYRALYNYKPQNEDELELLEGDTVHVMEKCDDGWFVGTSKRTGLFGTFPGNYVEKS